MGCGSSSTREKSNENSKMISTGPGAYSRSKGKNAPKTVKSFDLKNFWDSKVKTYISLIKNGLCYIAYNELKKNSNISVTDGEGFILNGSMIVPRIIEDASKVNELLGGNGEKLLKLKNDLKAKNKNAELGIHYNSGVLALFVIVNLHPEAYQDDLASLIETSKVPMSYKLQISDLFSFSYILKLTNALKNNTTIRTLDLSLISDDFVLYTVVNNLMTNTSIEKLSCPKLALTDESLGMMNDFFTYNQHVSKFRLETNKIENFEAIKDTLLNNPDININSLYISGNKITNLANLSSLLTKQSPQSKLEALNISKCSINNLNNFKTLFNSEKMATFYNLTKLNVSFNFVSLQILVDLVKNCKNLKNFNLQKIKFSTEEGASQLAALGEAYGNSQIQNFAINYDPESMTVNFFQGLSKSSKKANLDRHFKLLKNNMDEATTAAVLKSIGGVDSFYTVEFNNCSFTNSEVILQFMAKTKNLRNLVFSNCNLKQEDFVNIAKLYAANSTLTSLELEKSSFNSFNNAVIINFCDSLNASQGLVKLNLNWCLKSEFQPVFAYFCDKLKPKKLAHLSIENCEFPATDSFGESFAFFLNAVPNLISLKLGSKDEIYKPNTNSTILKTLITACPNLQEFHLTNIKVNYEAVNELLLSLANKLKILNLNNVSDSQMLESIAKLNNLEKLKLSMHNFDIEDAQILKTIVNKNFYSLELDVPYITATQMETILEGLKKNPNLINFSIFPNKKEGFAGNFLKSFDLYYKAIKDFEKLENVHILAPHISRDQTPSTVEKLDEMKEMVKSL